MKLRYCKKYDQADAVVAYKDWMLIIDFLGIHFIDKESGLEKDAIIDFYQGCEPRLFGDDFLLLKNEDHGYKTYDLKNRKPLSELKAYENGMIADHGDLIHDGKLYLLSGKNGDDFRGNFSFQNEDAPNNSLLIYSLKDLSLVDEIPFEKCIDRIIHVPFRDSFLFVGRDHHVYEMTKDGNMTLAEDAPFFVDNFLINEEKKQVYFITDFGVRLFDEKLKELNRYDLISDEYDQDAGILLQSGPELMTVPKQWLRKEIIHGIELISPSYMVMMSSKKTGATYSLSLISTENGNFDFVANFNYPIESIWAKDGILYVSTHRCILVMEAVDNDL